MNGALIIAYSSSCRGICELEKMTLVSPPVCVQDQLLGLHVQRHPDHLLWFPSECNNLKCIHVRAFESWLTCVWNIMLR